MMLIELDRQAKGLSFDEEPAEGSRALLGMTTTGTYRLFYARLSKETMRGLHPPTYP